MKSIRLVTFYEAPDCWDILLDADEEIEIDVQLDNYVSNNIKSINSPGFTVTDFTAPDNIDNGLIFDICNGKSFAHWANNYVDFKNEMYQSWIFIENDGEYVELELEPVKFYRIEEK